MFHPDEQLAFRRGHHVTPQYESAMVYPRDIQIKLRTKRQFMFKKVREGLFHLDDSRVSRLFELTRQVGGTEAKQGLGNDDSTSTLT